MVRKALLCAFALLSMATAQNNFNFGGGGGGGNNNNNDNNNNENNNDDNNNQDNNNNGGAVTLNANAVQDGSFSDGFDGGQGEEGQAASQTSQENFINFCDGQTLTNGLQIEEGSCNGIVMGQIPAKNNMISSIITFPQLGDTIQAGQDFTISVQTNNLEAGSFTNPDNTYYSAPQQVGDNGKVIGHTHVTVQDIGNTLNPEQPPDPSQFAFFKGINDAGNGNGLLSADVAGGLPAGNYRVCTLTSASNHQPVIMPVAQRGAQDDCTKFTVADNADDQNADDQNADDQNADDQNADDQNADDQNADDQNADDQNADDQNADDQNADDQNADDQNADDQNADDQNADDQNNNNNNFKNFGGGGGGGGGGFGRFGGFRGNKRSRLAKVAARHFVA